PVPAQHARQTVLPRALGGPLAAVSGDFPGERPEHHMKKVRVEAPKVTCGSCRKFDGIAWCRHWNFHTTAESPPCRFYLKARCRRLKRGHPFPPSCGART